MKIKKGFIAATLALTSLAVLSADKTDVIAQATDVLEVKNSAEKSEKPNILFILADDMGYSDIGCYGSEIETPNIDSLAANGVRLTGFTNTARCSPSRASILTGQYPLESGIPNLPEWDTRTEGGYLSENAVTIPEVLKENGYSTFMTGKWHLSKDIGIDVMDRGDSWPLARGFDKFYGTIPGGGSYFSPQSIWDNTQKIDEQVAADPDFYYTDAISDKCVEYMEECIDAGEPFFGYVAYTAPHFPLHAKEEDIAKYKGKYDEGWDVMREKRLARMKELGIVDEDWELANTHEYASGIGTWEEQGNKDYLRKCMEVYAAMIDCMDQGIGRILNSLEEKGELDNTVIIFMSDNGASGEVLANQVKDIDLVGTEASYNSVGGGWAQMSCTPFALFKKFVHNGGISTPFIMQWKNGIDSSLNGTIRKSRAQIHDIMPTILDITGTTYPEVYDGNEIMSLPCDSIMPIIYNDEPIRDTFFWEHEESMGVLKGDWKLVKIKGWDWELYNLRVDPTERNNMIGEYPDMANSLKKLYSDWRTEMGSDYGDNLLIDGDFENTARYQSKHDGWGSTGDVDAEFAETYQPYEGEWRLSHYMDKAYTVCTNQTLKEMSKGYYVLSAMTKRMTGDANFKDCYMYVKVGDKTYIRKINGSDSYVQNKLYFANEDCGNIEVGFYTSASAGAWLAVDKVELYLVTPVK